MKHLKMLGLAAVAACALMAFVGASSASAAGVLCEKLTLTEKCSSVGGTDHVKKESTLEYSLESGTSALLKGPFGETLATCTSSTVKGTTTTTGSKEEAVKGNISTLSFGPFGDNPACTVTVTSTGSLEVNNIAGTKNGTVKSTGATVILHNTPLFGECKYSTSGTTIGTLTGSSNTGGAATFDISATISSENGCPTGSWSGKYVATGATSSYNVLPS